MLHREYCFPNNRTGFNQMVKWSRKEAQKGLPLGYLMEPTGSYYEPLAYHLNKIGQTLYVVLPNKARKFCEYEGIKTKTDAMDARCLALMGCKNRKLRPWEPPSPIYRELRQLTRLRADLVRLRFRDLTLAPIRIKLHFHLVPKFPVFPRIAFILRSFCVNLRKILLRYNLFS